jgi:hypothetical protein
VTGGRIYCPDEDGHLAAYGCDQGISRLGACTGAWIACGRERSEDANRRMPDDVPTWEAGGAFDASVSRVVHFSKHFRLNTYA